MTSESPLVSIIIPTYNRAHLIGETLDSVLAQTYQNWECVMVERTKHKFNNNILIFLCYNLFVHYRYKMSNLFF